jgi:hypothetical protein
MCLGRPACDEALDTGFSKAANFVTMPLRPVWQIISRRRRCIGFFAGTQKIAASGEQSVDGGEKGSQFGG